MHIREASVHDKDSMWPILEPVIRAGETYTFPKDMSRNEALDYWFSAGHQVYIAVDSTEIVGTYFLRANQKGGGSHVANCAYITAQHAAGRGIARAMCAHSLENARIHGFRSMQFNFVVSTNDRAVRLWLSCGFAIAGRLPSAFLHPLHGYVDAFVMYRFLGTEDAS